MTTLHLGVIDVPYANYPTKSGGRKNKKVQSGTQTTGDVAEWLENKYHVMRVFYELHKSDIDQVLSDVLRRSFSEALATGRTPKFDMREAMDVLEKMFRRFIDSREMERIGYHGVPTRAAIEGINHRMKDPYTGQRRPSFKDTGLYEQAFKAWMTRD